MKTHTFKNNMASVVSTQIIVFVFGFIMSILNARLLGPEGVGVFALLNLLKTLNVRFTDFGFGRAFRFYSANGEINYYDLKKTVYLVGLIVGFAVLVLSIALKFLPINIWNEINLTVFLLFLPTCFLFVFIMYLRHLLHGQLLIRSINISEILERLLYILLFIFFVWYLELGLIGVSISLSISSIFLFIQLVFKAQKFKPDKTKTEIEYPKKKLFKLLWSYGQWSYYSSFIEYIFQNFPILFLKSMANNFSVIGYFNKAQGLANYPKQLSNPLSGLLFSYNAGSNEETASYRTEILCRFSFWIVTTFFIVLGIFIKPIIVVLYGKEFLPAAEIFYFLYPSIVFYIQSTYLSSAIAAMGLNKETFTIRVKSLPFIIIAVFILIKLFDIKGAAIAISFSSTILWIQYALKYSAITKRKLAYLIFLQKSDMFIIRRMLNKFTKRLKKS